MTLKSIGTNKQVLLLQGLVGINTEFLHSISNKLQSSCFYANKNAPKRIYIIRNNESFMF